VSDTSTKESATKESGAGGPDSKRSSADPGGVGPRGVIKDFEGAIAELESIVKKLEEGDLALEQSLALYERGVQLSRFCHARLEEAERRIEILNERGELKPAPVSLGVDKS
jgi:exodeoxyribonuclease VII small subunit